MSQDERLLLQQAARGDGEAFSRLFGPLLPSLAYFINTLLQSSITETEDIIQEILIQVWINRASLAIIDSPKSYLFKAARNEVLDIIKTEKIRKDHYRKYARNRGFTGEDADKALSDKEKREMLLDAIGRLKPLLQETARLRLVERWKVSEIAKALGISVDNTRKRLEKAQKQLEDHFQQKK